MRCTPKEQVDIVEGKEGSRVNESEAMGNGAIKNHTAVHAGLVLSAFQALSWRGRHSVHPLFWKLVPGGRLD